MPNVSRISLFVSFPLEKTKEFFLLPAPLSALGWASISFSLIFSFSVSPILRKRGLVKTWRKKEPKVFNIFLSCKLPTRLASLERVVWCPQEKCSFDSLQSERKKKGNDELLLENGLVIVSGHASLLIRCQQDCVRAVFFRFSRSFLDFESHICF